MNMKLITIFVFAFCAISQSAFVDNIKKCSLKEDECLKSVLKEVLITASDSGLPEYGIPKIDPFVIQNLALKLAGVMELDVIEGTLEGIKNCVIEKMHANMDAKKIEIDIMCPTVVAKLQYSIKSSPLIKTLLGNDVSGNGNAQVDANKIKISAYVAFKLEKDGENIYIKQQRGMSKVTFALLGNVKFQADNIKVGEEDVTGPTVDFMNQNSKPIIESFSSFFSDVGAGIVYDIADKFFSKEPANNLLTDVIDYV